jgi:hypothetical protein
MNEFQGLEELDDFLLMEDEIKKGLTRLGELASAEGLMINLGVVGGAVMVLEYGARQTTHDVDVIIFSPDSQKVLALAKAVATEYGWDSYWLNNDVEIFIEELFNGHVLFKAPGIEVWAASTVQMLALKVSAASDRGAHDYRDAQKLLLKMTGAKDEIWQKIQPYLVRGLELSSEDTFNDLWNDTYVYPEADNN